MTKATRGSKTLSLPAGICLGVGVSTVSTLLITAILAGMVQSAKIAPGSLSYGVMLLLMVSSILGALVSSGCIKQKRMIICLETSACYLAVLICITALFFDGMYKGVPVTALLVMGGGIIGGLLPAGQGRSPKTHKRKKRYG